MSLQSTSPVFIAASGDLRLSANQLCWPAQEAFERLLGGAIRAQGREVVCAHKFDQAKQHGFIDSQRKITTSQWPMMNAVLTGVTRDQMMARHKANHIQVAYAPSQEQALAALRAKAACFHRLGIEVCLCGVSQ